MSTLPRRVLRQFPLRKFVIWLAVAVVVLWGALRFLVDATFAWGANDRRAICEAVRGSHLLPSEGEVRFQPGLWQSGVVIYGVRDVATQDRLVEVVRATRERLEVKPVEIEFRTALTWRATGTDSKTRDDGDLLRTVVIR